VAWGCVGAAQACLQDSVAYAGKRTQFDRTLDQHQLIRRMLSDMYTNVAAARLMCLHAGRLKDQGELAVVETAMAKYFASTALTRIANDAVQIHGAYGCSPDHAVARYLRDAKVMEIIEGSTQIHQSTIAELAQQMEGA
jgi:alkylation response protein AidB-like acyl-CoA dehydrogenase